jgi:hypothetical protein
LIIIPITLLFFIIFSLVLRNQHKAGLFVSIGLLLFFSFGHITLALGNSSTRIMGILFTPNKSTVLLFSIILLCSFILLIRYKITPIKFTNYLNIFASILILIQIVSIAYSYISRSEGYIQSGTINTKRPDILPDIYYITLDGYGRADILREIYNYDNSEFIDYLQESGFYIASESHSNYCQTLLSIFSSFHLNYLQEMDIPIDINSNDRIILAKNLWENENLIYLRSQLEYSLVNFAAGYSLIELGRFDAFLVQGINLNEFHHALIRLTPIHMISRHLLPQYKTHNKRILFTMNKAPDIKEVNSPKFVYTHILAPHPPFTFDENGMLQSSDYNFIASDGSHYYDKGGTVDKYLEGYVNNIKALNNLLKTLINRIKENSEQPFIIILQGDHGPGSGLDWASLENTNIRERFSILNAYYFYDQNYSSLYPLITPINTFRVIFNQYFGTDFELHTDRSFYSTWEKPYKFTEVTDSLQANQISLDDPAVEK